MVVKLKKSGSGVACVVAFVTVHMQMRESERSSMSTGANALLQIVTWEK